MSKWTWKQWASLILMGVGLIGVIVILCVSNVEDGRTKAAIVGSLVMAMLGLLGIKKAGKGPLMVVLIPLLIVGSSGCPGTWKEPASSRFTFVDNAPDKKPLEPVGKSYAPVWQAAIAAGATIFEPLAGIAFFSGMALLQVSQNFTTVRGQAVHAVVGAPATVAAEWGDTGSIKKLTITPLGAVKPKEPPED